MTQAFRLDNDIRFDPTQRVANNRSNLDTTRYDFRSLASHRWAERRLSRRALAGLHQNIAHPA